MKRVFFVLQNIVIFLLAGVFCMGCADGKILHHRATALEEPVLAYQGDPFHEPYVLGPTDAMEVSVWGQDDLKRAIVVSPAGRIDFPLIGQVQVFGLTADQLRSELQDRLAVYIKNPRVDINLTAFHSLNVYVLGEVRTPGLISPQRYLSVHQAIAAAGGSTVDARHDYALLLRRDMHDNSLHGYAVSLALDAANQTALILKGGDILYVARTEAATAENFMRFINNLVSPLANVGRGIIMVPDVVDVFSGEAFKSGYGTSENAQAIVPAQ